MVDKLNWPQMLVKYHNKIHIMAILILKYIYLAFLRCIGITFSLPLSFSIWRNYNIKESEEDKQRKTVIFVVFFISKPSNHLYPFFQKGELIDHSALWLCRKAAWYVCGIKCLPCSRYTHKHLYILNVKHIGVC